MDRLENKIGKLLSGKGLTLAVVESATGGLISHRITNASAPRCITKAP
jgi:nicotinamide mononucleotide (NMN) deamidase PncC